MLKLNREKIYTVSKKLKSYERAITTRIKLARSPESLAQLLQHSLLISIPLCVVGPLYSVMRELAT